MVCQRVYYISQAYQSHLRRQNRACNAADIIAQGSLRLENDTPDARMNTLSLECSEDTSTEASQDIVDKKFLPSACLFWPIVSSDMQDSLFHMHKVHGLFIPNPEHLIDMESFLSYLFTIISEFQESLYCSITKRTVEGIQRHMKDKGHCKINLDEGSEWRLFYEYLGSESKGEASQSGHVASIGTGGKIISLIMNFSFHQARSLATAHKRDIIGKTHKAEGSRLHSQFQILRTRLRHF